MEKILVIEDDAAVQRALQRTFDSAGFDVSIASDGATAMETFRATMPRLVILDLRLPVNRARTCVAKSNTKVPMFQYSS